MLLFPSLHICKLRHREVRKERETHICWHPSSSHDSLPPADPHPFWVSLPQLSGQLTSSPTAMTSSVFLSHLQISSCPLLSVSHLPLQTALLPASQNAGQCPQQNPSFIFLLPVLLTHPPARCPSPIPIEDGLLPLRAVAAGAPGSWDFQVGD